MCSQKIGLCGCGNVLWVFVLGLGLRVCIGYQVIGCLQIGHAREILEPKYNRVQQGGELK